MRAQMSRRIGFEHFHEAAQSCREFQRLEERGQLDELCARYTNLRRYLPTFFSLPFAGEKGSEDLLAALRLVRRLDAGKIEDLPKNAPCHFVPAAWRPALYRDDGTVDRRIWVIALSQAVRDALRAGELYLPGSRHHISFWNPVYDEQRWASERKSAYASLGLPTEAETVLGKLRHEYTDAVRRAAGGLDENMFASVWDGRLQLKRADALEIPERTRQLRHAIETTQLNRGESRHALARWLVLCQSRRVPLWRLRRDHEQGQLSELAVQCGIGVEHDGHHENNHPAAGHPNRCG